LINRADGEAGGMRIVAYVENNSVEAGIVASAELLSLVERSGRPGGRRGTPSGLRYCEDALG